MAVLRSRDNPKVKRWHELATDARARRKEGRAIIDGPHLVESWLKHRGQPVCVMVCESVPVSARGAATVLLSEAAMRYISDVRSPQGIAAEIVIPRDERPLFSLPSCIFLDGIQDAGNVGAILRSACAFGALDIVLGMGCADPWSPKVLRAAAGAHALLRIRETTDLAAAIDAFDGTVYWTSPRGGDPLANVDLDGRVGWLFGAEGQGVAPELAAHASAAVTIPMPGDAESLNVAVAAAICFYEQNRRHAAAA